MLYYSLYINVNKQNGTHTHAYRNRFFILSKGIIIIENIISECRTTQWAIKRISNNKNECTVHRESEKESES